MHKLSFNLSYTYLRQMEELLQQIENYKLEITAVEANTVDAVEAFRIKYLGTKGLMKTVMGEMKNVPNEKKKEAGQILNDFKIFVEEKYNTLKENTQGADESTVDSIDWSLPGNPAIVGTRHPLNLS